MKRKFNLDKKFNKAKDKIGKLQGKLIILQFKDPERYLLSIENEKGKKIKNIFSSLELEIVKKVADRLSSELTLPYDSTPKEKIVGKRGKQKSKGKHQEFPIDHSIFKMYKNIPFIALDFGVIILNDNNVEAKAYAESFEEGKETIGSIITTPKVSAGFIPCSEQIKTYSERVIGDLFDDISRFGCLEDKNSVRGILGQLPVYPVYNEEKRKLQLSEVVNIAE